MEKALKYSEVKAFNLRMEYEKYNKLRKIAYFENKKITNLLQEGIDFIIKKYKVKE
ncbi:MAG: hypothetical protein ACXWE7_12060 [Nitrososphaeraceae archaeon]